MNTQKLMKAGSLSISVLLLIAFATTALAEKGGIPGKPPKGEAEEAGNNLSFPVLFAESAALGPTIPNDGGNIGQGEYRLEGEYVEIDQDYLAYPQKDPMNVWMAEWLDEQVVLNTHYIDVGDNLEAVPWRTTSVVRVEFVPFHGPPLVEEEVEVEWPTFETFEMYYVGGQGPSEVWGAVATNVESPVALRAPQPYATLYSDTMQLSLTKLEPGSGDLNVDPDPDGDAYVWDVDQLIWRRNVETGDDSVAQIFTEDFTAEINVKGRVIYGYNWFLKKTIMNSDVSRDGWWRLTFYSSDGQASPLNFLDTTLKFDPTNPEVELMAEPGDGTYPREAVVDDVKEIVYIDIYIEVSNAGGKGKGNGKGNQ